MGPLQVDVSAVSTGVFSAVRQLKERGRLALDAHACVGFLPALILIV